MLWGESAESHPVNHLPSPWAPHLDNPFTFLLVPKVCEAWPQPFPPESIEGPAIGTSDVTCSGASYRGAARGSERFKTPPEVSTESGKGETWIKDPQTTGGSASSLKLLLTCSFFLSERSLPHKQPELTLSSSTPTRSLRRKREISSPSLITFSTAEK